MALLALLSALVLSGCDNPRERSCRGAVKQLVEAGPATKDQALAAVVRYGHFALPDIEQAMHGAELYQQLRLLDAVEKIADPEAKPLLAFYRKWGKSSVLRSRAADVAERLSKRR